MATRRGKNNQTIVTIDVGLEAMAYFQTLAHRHPHRSVEDIIEEQIRAIPRVREQLRKLKYFKQGVPRTAAEGEGFIVTMIHDLAAKEHPSSTHPEDPEEGETP